MVTSPTSGVKGEAAEAAEAAMWRSYDGHLENAEFPCAASVFQLRQGRY